MSDRVNLCIQQELVHMICGQFVCRRHRVQCQEMSVQVETATEDRHM